MITDKLRGSGDDDKAPQQQQDQQYAPQQGQHGQQNPCQQYMQQFMDCANTQNLDRCEIFQDQWKQCKVDYGM